MAERGAFPAPRALEIHVVSDDAGCEVALVHRLTDGIARTRCAVVPGAQHQLPTSYLKHVVESACGT